VWINVNGFLNPAMHGQVGLLVANHAQGNDVDWAWLARVTDAALFNAGHHHGAVKVLVRK
jgi:hypothetical protein